MLLGIILLETNGYSAILVQLLNLSLTHVHGTNFTQETPSHFLPSCSLSLQLRIFSQRMFLCIYNVPVSDHSRPRQTLSLHICILFYKFH